MRLDNLNGAEVPVRAAVTAKPENGVDGQLGRGAGPIRRSSLWSTGDASTP